MKTYVGVDPGKTGCVAVIVPAKTEAEFSPAKTWSVTRDVVYMAGEIIFYDYPVNLAALAASLPKNNCFVLLEKAQVMRKKGVVQGTVSMLTYGIGYGEYLGMLKAFQIPFGEIHPMSWKKEFSLVHQPKEESIFVARNLYPMVADQFKLKKHHGRAEALLIAEYARRKNM